MSAPLMADAVDRPRVEGTAFTILAAISVAHLLNDAVQALLPSLYPTLKASFRLTFTEIGLITLMLQLTSSLVQPLVGLYTDRRSTPYSLVVGMGVSLVGILLLSSAANLGTILLAAGLMGVGSAVFHPESSRVARMASGGQHGLAQSLFQVGGNFGSSLGPLLAAYFVVPRGLPSLAWCSLLTLAAMVVLFHVGRWYKERRPAGISTRRSCHLESRLSRWTASRRLSFRKTKGRAPTHRWRHWRS